MSILSSSPSAKKVDEAITAKELLTVCTGLHLPLLFLLQTRKPEATYFAALSTFSSSIFFSSKVGLLFWQVTTQKLLSPNSAKIASLHISLVGEKKVEEDTPYI